MKPTLYQRLDCLVTLRHCRRDGTIEEHPMPRTRVSLECDGQTIRLLGDYTWCDVTFDKEISFNQVILTSPEPTEFANELGLHLRLAVVIPLQTIPAHSPVRLITDGCRPTEISTQAFNDKVADDLNKMDLTDLEEGS